MKFFKYAVTQLDINTGRQDTLKEGTMRSNNVAFAVRNLAHHMPTPTDSNVVVSISIRLDDPAEQA